MKTQDIVDFCLIMVKNYASEDTKLRAEYTRQKQEYMALPWYKKLVSTFDEQDFKFRLNIIKQNILDIHRVLDQVNYYIRQEGYVIINKSMIKASSKFWREFFAYYNK